jgi:hypothetical protein
MKIVILGLAPLLILVAMRIQWSDCIRGYGNTMGVFGLINSIWMIAGIFLGIGVSSFISWQWAIVAGVVVYALYYPISSGIERLGVKYGPRTASKKTAQQAGSSNGG